MMRLLFLFICLSAYGVVTGQYKGPKFPIKDDWLWNYGAKGLQVGDKMPDIPLGTTINNKTGKTRFSQFKGKLVILDFFSSGCSNCFEGFPEMEKLQKEFGDQIQIILVDPWETEEQLRERIGMRDPKLYKLPDLPRIVSNRAYVNAQVFDNDTPLIMKYFPLRGNPHHVWIDDKGIVRLRGSNYNTYAEKIKKFLSGEPIQILEDLGTLPNLFNDRTARYYQQLGYMRQTSVSCGSFITPYTKEINGTYDGVRVIVDTVTSTRITSYINQRLLDLYNKCYGNNKATRKAYSNFLFSASTTVTQYTQFPIGIDTLIYTSDRYIIQRPLTTEEIIRSKYCYEQIVPLVLSEEERMQMMLEDLNRYFKLHYGIVGAIENRKVPFYELIRTTEQDKVTINSPEFLFHEEVLTQDGQLELDYKGPVSELFTSWLRNKQLKISQGLLYDAAGHPFLIYNNTGWDRKQLVSMNIPLADLHTLVDLRRLLQPYGLDLVERYGDLPFLVFTRVSKPE